MGRAGADARGAGCGFRGSLQFVAPFFLHRPGEKEGAGRNRRGHERGVERPVRQREGQRGVRSILFAWYCNKDSVDTTNALYELLDKHTPAWPPPKRLAPSERRRRRRTPSAVWSPAARRFGSKPMVSSKTAGTAPASARAPRKRRRCWRPSATGTSPSPASTGVRRRRRNFSKSDRSIRHG